MNKEVESFPEDIKTHMTERLFYLPEEILKLRKKQLKAIRDENSVRDDIKDYENDMWLDIYNDSTLTNEKKRQAAFNDKKMISNKWSLLKESLDETTDAKNKIDLQLEKLMDEQKNFRALCYLELRNER